MSETKPPTGSVMAGNHQPRCLQPERPRAVHRRRLPRDAPQLEQEEIHIAYGDRTWTLTAGRQPNR